MNLINLTLNRLINIRGMEEQAFKFATGWKGGMKGCKINRKKTYAVDSPLENNIKGINIDPALDIHYMHTKTNPICFRTYQNNADYSLTA